MLLHQGGVNTFPRWQTDITLDRYFMYLFPSLALLPRMVAKLKYKRLYCILITPDMVPNAVSTLRGAVSPFLPRIRSTPELLDGHAIAQRTAAEVNSLEGGTSSFLARMTHSLH